MVAKMINCGMRECQTENRTCEEAKLEVEGDKTIQGSTLNVQECKASRAVFFFLEP
jgi:hypothetical protein